MSAVQWLKKEVLVSGAADGAAKVWDSRSQAPTASTSFPSPITSLSSASANIVLAGCQDGTLMSWDLRTNAIDPLAAFSPGAAVRSVAAKKVDGNLKVAAASDDGTLRVLTVGAQDFGATLDFHPHGADYCRAVAWAGDNVLVSGAWDGTVVATHL